MDFSTHHTQNIKTPHNNKRAGGFTLVELAIVMIIIGLLLTGILKAQTMIENSRVKASIRDVQQLATAHYVFIDKYDALPGDMNNATTRLSGCTAANSCANGNGDDMLGSLVDTATPPAGTANISENIQYWKHLALADLIDNVTINADSDPGASSYGQSHPAARIGGGWNAVTINPGDNGWNGRRGVAYLLSATPNTNDIILTPLTAQRFDHTLDDARPNTGVVTAAYAADNCKDDAQNIYVTANETIACILYYRIVK